MVQIGFDMQRASEVERNIAPPMWLAVTIPVTIDGQPSAYAVYVARSPFGASMVSQSQFAAVVRKVSAALGGAS